MEKQLISCLKDNPNNIKFINSITRDQINVSCKIGSENIYPFSFFFQFPFRHSGQGEISGQ